MAMRIKNFQRPLLRTPPARAHQRVTRAWALTGRSVPAVGSPPAPIEPSTPSRLSRIARPLDQTERTLCSRRRIPDPTAGRINRNAGRPDQPGDDE
eukprot:8948285-Pyramimonas_sp.AAC.1